MKDDDLCFVNGEEKEILNNDKLCQLLHDAFMLKAKEEFESYPSDEEIEKIHVLSPEFAHGMEKMMEECFENNSEKP